MSRNLFSAGSPSCRPTYRPQLEVLGDRLAPGSLFGGGDGPEIDPTVLMAVHHAQASAIAVVADQVADQAQDYAAARAAHGDNQIVAVITGGGQASFDDRDGGTVFGMGMTLNEDGSAEGHFNCLVPGVVVINGQVESWTVQDGVYTVSGTARVSCPGEPKSDDPACQDVTFDLTIDATGGAGVGHFTYNDSFLEGAGFPPDQETVTQGQIQIHTPQG